MNTIIYYYNLLPEGVQQLLAIIGTSYLAAGLIIAVACGVVAGVRK